VLCSCDFWIIMVGYASPLLVFVLVIAITLAPVVDVDAMVMGRIWGLLASAPFG
jgi:hypothetical protein